MARFTKYIHTHYIEPERAPLRQAARSHQKLTKLLERDPRFLDLPNFAVKLRDLSPVPEKIDTALSKLSVKGSKRASRKDLISAALAGFSEKHLYDPSWREKYRALRKMQLQSPEPAKRGGRTNVPPTGGDRRRYNPAGKATAYTKHGGFASYALGNPLRSSWMQVFRNPAVVIPCIQRKTRREVMFAKGKGGRAYHVRHRRGPFSGVPC